MANKCLNSVQRKSDAVKIHKIVAENAGDSSASNNKPNNNNNNRPSISTNSGFACVILDEVLQQLEHLVPPSWADVMDHEEAQQIVDGHREFIIASKGKQISYAITLPHAYLLSY